MNAFETAFRSIGVAPRDVRLSIALAEFFNNGGTEEEAIRLVRAAFRSGSEGHGTVAGDGLPPNANASRHDAAAPDRRAVADKANGLVPGAAATPCDGAGQDSPAEKAMAFVPAAVAPKRSGAGQFAAADKAMQIVPRPVPPGYLAAARAGRAHLARSVLDSFRLRDGRAVGDVQFFELEGLRTENAREAALIRMIQRHAVNVPGDAKVREFVKIADLERMIQKAAEVTDVS